MGWLGWTEEQTLNTSVWAIDLAYEGRLEMLDLCYGFKPKDNAAGSPVMKPATKANLLAAFMPFKGRDT